MSPLPIFKKGKKKPNFWPFWKAVNPSTKMTVLAKNFSKIVDCPEEHFHKILSHHFE